MSTGHKIYISALSAIVVASLFILVKTGYHYYTVPLEERFFDPGYDFLKPGGTWGHGIGIIGSFCMIAGVALYSGRKRISMMRRMGILKHWLEFHIFLCTLGPFLVLFHTSFKFGGLVAVSFWSMVAVFLSGIIGRYIYIQIPRSKEGQELSLAEVREMKNTVASGMAARTDFDEETSALVEEVTRKRVELYHENFFVRVYNRRMRRRKSIRDLKILFRKKGIEGKQSRQILKLVRKELSLNRKIERLSSMQRLFKYWHVAHIPFAIVMLIIMIIHVAVTIALGYRWIF
ncbi:MAG: hypothetical protein ACM3N9_01695 [Syntrophothermus sp.]